MDGNQVAKQTPSEKFIRALKEYAESEMPGQTVIVSEYAAVLYIESIDQQGETENTYLHVTSHRSSWHSLRGLVQTLADHVYRKRTR